MFARLNSRIHLFRRKWGMLWNIIVGSALLFLSFVIGVVGYMTIEGWDFVSSFYMSVITLSTVGFMEVQPMSDAGRMFTSFLIFSGVGGFMYIVVAFSQFLVEGRLQIMWGRRRMLKAIERLKDHFIVCGYGRIGGVVVKEILEEGYDVVALEQDPELIAKMEADGLLCIEGDATDDQLLMMAGIDRARSLITALSNEAANVYVTLTARQIAPDLSIVARAGHQSHVTRLELAGADRVVLPHLIGGVRMAQNVLRPSVTNFLELAMRGSLELQMEELVVPGDSPLAGKDLIQSEIRPNYNLIIIAIKKGDESMIYNPGPKEVIQGGDTLIMVGKRSDFKAFRAFIYPEVVEADG